MKSGHFDPETGNFTGLVGELVNNHGDVCFQSIVISGLVDELQLATVTANLYLHALVSKGNITNHSPDIMEVFSVISGICYMAFATVCVMMAIVIAFNESIALKISITVWVFYEKLAKVLWTSFLALIDQDNFMVTRWPSKIGWWMMCVSIFVAMQGYILNLVSTDIAVPS